MRLSEDEMNRLVDEIVRHFQVMLDETPRLPDAMKKKRAKERRKDSEERQRDNEKEMKKYSKKRDSTHGLMDDVMNSFRKYANGVMQEDEELEEEGKKKPACGGVKGSALYHDENGFFVGKDDAVVRSLKKYTGSDCRHGSTRVKGKNDSIATKLPCGSKTQTKDGGVGKHPNRCKGK